MNPVVTIALNDLRLLVRDRGTLFLTFAWPILLALFFGVLGANLDALATAPFINVSGQDAGQALATSAFRVESMAPPDAFAVTLPQGMMWATLACTATFGLSIVAERNRGTMLRLFVSPNSRATILGGKALACGSCIVLLLCCHVGFAALTGMASPQSLPLLAVAVISIAVAFVGIMMLLSVLVQNTQGAAGISWAVLMVMAMLGGGMMPRFLMPSWLQDLAVLSPVAWGILALEGPLWRGHSLADMLPVCGALIAIGIAAFSVGAARFHYD